MLEFTPVSVECGDAVLNGIESGATPDFLLLHAGEEHAGVFKPVMQRLHANGFSSVAYDQRGHGTSRELNPIPLTRMATDAMAMIETMDQPIVVGASLGGFVLMTALADADVQSSVKALVLLDVIPDPDPIPVRAFLTRALENGLESPVIEHILDQAEHLRECCAVLTMPVLLVRAGHGTTMTDDNEARFRKLVPHAKVVTIESAAHLIAQTAPGELSDTLISFAISLT